MAEYGEKNNGTGVYGGTEFSTQAGNVTEFGTIGTDFGTTNYSGEVVENAGSIKNTNLPVKNGFWSKFKAFWLQEIDWNKEIKVVLTPAQQKVEDEINEFLHQEITWEKVHDFLFQEVKFTK